MPAEPTPPTPGPLGRLRAHWRWLLGVWSLATVLGLLIARTTRIGQVLVVFVPGHGVHVGDAAAFGSLYLLAGLLTVHSARR